MTIYIAGNGGLASHSSHFAAELTGKYAYDVYISCVDLTSNNAQLTALANDIGYENVFAHLLQVMGKQGDTFIGMTTSHAPNILKAVDVAKKKGMKIILLDADNLKGKDTAEKQEYALKYLHKLARSMKLERIQK